MYNFRKSFVGCVNVSGAYSIIYSVGCIQKLIVYNQIWCERVRADGVNIDGDGAVAATKARNGSSYIHDEYYYVCNTICIIEWNSSTFW